MTTPSLGGLIWRSQWHAPGEGPYSTVAKLLHANYLPPSSLRGAIRWSNPEGPSLLSPKLLQSSTERVALLGRMLQDASISTLAQYMHVELAGDQVLRYCRTCMGTGFQATVAQIDGLDACPIHNEPYFNSCAHCGAKMPPYRLGDGDRIPRFSCWKCCRALGHGGLIERKFDAWIPPDNLDRLSSIHQWLRKIEDYWCLGWPTVSGWDTTKFVEEGEDIYRRRAIFAVLRTLVPDRSIPCPKFEPNVKILGPFAITRNLPPLFLTQLESQATRKLRPGSEIGEYRRNLRTPSFGVPVPDTPLVPPTIHAKLIWRAQFENTVDDLDEHTFPTEFSLNTISDLLNARLTIPSEAFGDTTIVEAALAATWLVAERIAAEWHRLLVDLCSSCNTTRIDEGWLTACNRWARRLGRWKDNGYFPIGVVIARDPKSGASRLYLTIV